MEGTVTMTSLYQHKCVPYLIGNPDDKDLDDMYLLLSVYAILQSDYHDFVKNILWQETLRTINDKRVI